MPRRHPTEPLVVEPSQETRATWLTRPYLSPALRTQLATADILVVPREDYPGSTQPLFPDLTYALLQHFRQDLPAGTTSDICIEDADYYELAEQDAWIELGKFVASNIACPILVLSIWRFIEKRLNPEQDRVDVEITRETDAGSVRIAYRGPAGRFLDTLRPVLEAPGAISSQPAPSAAQCTGEDHVPDHRSNQIPPAERSL